MKFELGFLFLNALLPKKCSYQKKKAKLLSRGEDKLDKSLDILRVIRSNMALSTLLRLYLRKDERKLLKYQHRNTVLKGRPSSSSSSD